MPPSNASIGPITGPLERLRDRDRHAPCSQRGDWDKSGTGASPLEARKDISQALGLLANSFQIVLGLLLRVEVVASVEGQLDVHPMR